MSARPCKRDWRQLAWGRAGRRPPRRAMTLVELTVAVAVMSLVAVVLGGLISAVHTGREHVGGVQEATAQGRFAVNRVRDAVARAGVYQIGAGSTVPGVSVVWTPGSPVDRPETLVLWTGGRDASLAGQTLTRLPKASELLIYVPDPAAPQRLLEIVLPGAIGDVDFMSAGFPTLISQLIGSSAAEKATICDRVRVGSTGSGSAPAIRFEIEAVPTDGQLVATAVNTPAWSALPWVNGSCSSTSGLRQTTVRVELQTVTLRRPGTNDGPSLPVFGSAVLRYVHRKG